MHACAYAHKVIILFTILNGIGTGTFYDNRKRETWKPRTMVFQTKGKNACMVHARIMSACPKENSVPNKSVS
jgi:hypothetical protein